jgi:ASC-1-like (ASCH) protein
MDHVAIMNKSWKLIDKILLGKKTIESRWYKAKVAPWNRISEGDIVYFKDAGCKISAKAEVIKVLQFNIISDGKTREIIDLYGGEGKICFSSKENAYEWAKGKKYCVLVFLKNPVSVVPFEISKKGFGNACAWMAVGRIEDVKM